MPNKVFSFNIRLGKLYRLFENELKVLYDCFIYTFRNNPIWVGVGAIKGRITLGCVVPGVKAYTSLYTIGDFELRGKALGTSTRG